MGGSEEMLPVRRAVDNHRRTTAIVGFRERIDNRTNRRFPSALPWADLLCPFGAVDAMKWALAEIGSAG